MKRHALYLDILDQKRKGMLPKLGFLRKEFGFYCAGGTALALQMRHRTSVDFDFYTRRNFDPNVLYKRLGKTFDLVESINLALGTLVVAVKGVNMSFFYYDYLLLKPLVRTGHMDLASLEDIAAMKMIAVVQRGTKRDFIDIYYLLKRCDLDTLLRLTERKYSAFNRYIGLRGLTYFEDAEEDRSRRGINTFEKVSWNRIKQEIVSVVSEYKKRILPHK